MVVLISKATMAENIAQLEVADAESLVRLFRDRFVQKKPYVMCGNICVSINPLEWLPIYDETSRQVYIDTNITEPAHIYIVAEMARKRISRSSQTIVITGESGAGKTEVARLCLDYISHNRADALSATQIQRALHTGPVLEYLGNAQTLRNGNSSRFGKFLRLFHRDTLQVGANVHTYLLEKNRVMHTSPGEGNFRIFYAVLYDEGMRDEYALYPIEATTLGSPRAAIESVWTDFERAAQTVGFGVDDLRPLVHVVVAIMWLAVRDFANASKLLGVEVSVLTKTLSNRRTRVANEEDYWSECSFGEMKTRINALATGLYHRMFGLMVRQMNAFIGEASDSDGCVALNLLDIFGFEAFETNGFEQMCINYCNERIQQLFVNDVIVMQQLEYINEGIEWSHIEFDTNSRVVELCEETLFPLLDEAQRLRTSPEAFVETVNARRPVAFSVPLVRKSSTVFSIDHYAGKVLYNTQNFIERNTDELRPEIIDMMAASSDPTLASLFVAEPATASTNLWTRSVATTFLHQMRSLCDTTIDGEALYIRCIKPNATGTPGMFDATVVHRQIVSNGLIHACHVMREGYEHRMTRLEFARRHPHIMHARKFRSLLSQGGVWGKTMVYMSDACFKRIRDMEAAYTVTRGLRRCGRIVRACRKIQRAWRRLFRRRAAKPATLRLNAALSIQHSFRQHANRASRSYRLKNEVDRLREQVEVLTKALEQRDAWIFRAMLLLKAQDATRTRTLMSQRPGSYVDELPSVSTGEPTRIDCSRNDGLV